MMRMRGLFLTGLLAAGAALHAQDVPAGWQVVKDTQKVCQMAVPPDWKNDSIVKSFMMSADKSDNAVVHGLRPGQTFEQGTSTAKQMMKPTKTFEDSGKRVWYAYETPNGKQSGATNWYVAVPGSPVCTMQISFKNAAAEDVAKKIAMSLTQAK